MRSTVFQSQQPTMIFKLNQKVTKKDTLEKLIYISSILLIGYIYVWILAIYWIQSYKNKSLEMFAMWRQNPNFQGSFPFLPDFHASLTQHPAYYDKLRKAESSKSALMYALAIPFVGYALVLIVSLATLGIVPLAMYYTISGPTRYVKNIQKQMRYHVKTEGKGYRTPSDPPAQKVYQPPVQVTTTKPTKLKEDIVHTQSKASTPTAKTPKITKITDPFFCQVCEASRPSTMQRMKCETCSRFVCFDCFTQMVNVGKTDCPMCGGRLYSQ